MNIGYYPGCSLEVTAKAFDLSFRQSCDTLGIALEEVPEWQCCGSSAALKKSRRLSLALAAHNLTQTRQLGLNDLVAPCPFCHRRLLSAQQEISGASTVDDDLEDMVPGARQQPVSLHSLLGFMLRSVGLPALKAAIQKPLQGLRVIPYYGCYTVKPAAITQFDDPEHPTAMDRILAELGAEVLDWDFKTECCGASLSLSKTDMVLELSGRLLKEAVWRGADVIAVVCQLCHSNLDLRQAEIWKRQGTKHHLPILYITQLMGLAFGHAPGALGIRHHIMDPMPVLREKGFAP